MSAQVHSGHGLVPPLEVSYRNDSIEALLARPGTLAVIAFGDRRPDRADPRLLYIPLEGPDSGRLVEHWCCRGPVHSGRSGAIRYACDTDWLFGAVELDEADFGGDIAAATAEAYRMLAGFHREGSHPALLRVWNYFDAITDGRGDDERYRRFCVGRATGFVRGDAGFPAATAIGRRDGRRLLQLYWLAARSDGIAVENPRQVAAYRYPRQYGPQPPSFARATAVATEGGAQLLISGTASVVGHASCHPDDLGAQVGETVANLQSLLAAARRRRPELPEVFDASTRLKVYVRDATQFDVVAALLAERLPGTHCLLLAADVCRRDLLIEIDGIHGR